MNEIYDYEESTESTILEDWHKFVTSKIEVNNFKRDLCLLEKLKDSFGLTKFMSRPVDLVNGKAVTARSYRIENDEDAISLLKEEIRKGHQVLLYEVYTVKGLTDKTLRYGIVE